jgi:hypothetical protein
VATLERVFLHRTKINIISLTRTSFLLSQIVVAYLPLNSWVKEADPSPGNRRNIAVFNSLWIMQGMSHCA